MESEIAQIKQNIELECVALRLAMDGFAAGASHQSITARYQRLGIFQTQLEKLVGSQAEEIVCEMYNHTMG